MKVQPQPEQCLGRSWMPSVKKEASVPRRLVSGFWYVWTFKFVVSQLWAKNGFKSLNHFLLSALQFFYWPTKTKLDQTPMQISLFSRFTRLCRVRTKNDKRFSTRDNPLLKALVWACVPVFQGASGESWREFDSWCWCAPKASTIPPEWPGCVFWVSLAWKYPKHPLCLPRLHCAALLFCVPTENANTEGRPWISCFYLQDQCHNLKVFSPPTLQEAHKTLGTTSVIVAQSMRGDNTTSTGSKERRVRWGCAELFF